MKKYLSNLVLIVLVVAGYFIVSRNFTELKPSGELLMAKDFSLPYIRGGEGSYDLSFFRPQKRPMLINFWASWCDICEQEDEIINQISKKYSEGQRLTVVGIASFDKASEVLATKKRSAVNFPILLDEYGHVAKSYGVDAVPQTLLIGSNGKICQWFKGALNEDSLSKIEEVLLGIERDKSCQKTTIDHNVNTKVLSIENRQSYISSTIPPFELINQNNQKVTNDDYRQTIWVVNFIFTSCQHVCPTLTKKMQELHEYYKEIDGVKFVSISVDPERDQPRVLFEYAKKYKADLRRWHFLTGTWGQIKKLVSEGFQVPGVENPVFHTDRFVLIDKGLKIKDFYPVDSKDEIKKLKNDISLLLNK